MDLSEGLIMVSSIPSSMQRTYSETSSVEKTPLQISLMMMTISSPLGASVDQWEARKSRVERIEIPLEEASMMMTTMTLEALALEA